MNKAKKLKLFELAALPLKKIMVSAECSDNGNLDTVGRFAEKLAAAKDNDLLMAGVAVGQNGCSATDKKIIAAENLQELAIGIQTKTNALYGEYQDWSQDLLSTDNDADNNYKATQFHPFGFLNEQLANFLKTNDKGYLLVVGGAANGKTSWALNWVRESRGDIASKTLLPTLSGWFFARRFEKNAYRDEVSALQTLVALARRNHRHTVAKHTPSIWSKDKTYKQYEDYIMLRDNFTAALSELQNSGNPPSKENPLILLLDGADELWASGSGNEHARNYFPTVLPNHKDLPEHTYIVMLSRPGKHLTPPPNTTINRIDLTAEKHKEYIHQSMRDYLNQAVKTYKKSFHQKEKAILTDNNFQRNIINTAGGAFGYVTGIIRYLLGETNASQRLQKLEQWKEQPDTLPQGIYQLRTKEILDVYCLITGAKTPSSYKGDDFLKGLALMTVIKRPLTAKTIAIFLGLEPHDYADWLWQHAGKFLRKDEDGYLTFDHDCIGQIVTAFWQLQNGDSDPEDKEKAISQILTDKTDNTTTSISTAKLHAIIGQHFERFKGYFFAVQNKQKPLDSIGDGNAENYLLTWGVWHVLSTLRNDNLSPFDNDKSLSTCDELRKDCIELLLHAGFLQTIIRHSDEADKVIRESYLAADNCPEGDKTKELRWKIENNLFQWWHALKAEQTLVGGLLWNLLGGWENAKPYAENWKAAIDKPTLISRFPSTPPESEFRTIEQTIIKLSKCGNWMVSNKIDKLEIWDLRQGIHRSYIWRELDNVRLSLSWDICVYKDELMVFHLYESECTVHYISLKDNRIETETQYLKNIFSHNEMTTGSPIVALDSDENNIYIFFYFKYTIFLKNEVQFRCKGYLLCISKRDKKSFVKLLRKQSDKSLSSYDDSHCSMSCDDENILILFRGGDGREEFINYLLIEKEKLKNADGLTLDVPVLFFKIGMKPNTNIKAISLTRKANADSFHLTITSDRNTIYLYNFIKKSLYLYQKKVLRSSNEVNFISRTDNIIGVTNSEKQQLTIIAKPIYDLYENPITSASRRCYVFTSKINGIVNNTPASFLLLAKGKDCSEVTSLRQINSCNKFFIVAGYDTGKITTFKVAKSDIATISIEEYHSIEVCNSKITALSAILKNDRPVIAFGSELGQVGIYKTEHKNCIVHFCKGHHFYVDRIHLLYEDKQIFLATSARDGKLGIISFNEKELLNQDSNNHSLSTYRKLPNNKNSLEYLQAIRNIKHFIYYFKQEWITKNEYKNKSIGKISSCDSQASSNFSEQDSVFFIKEQKLQVIFPIDNSQIGILTLDKKRFPNEIKDGTKCRSLFQPSYYKEIRGEPFKNLSFYINENIAILIGQITPYVCSLLSYNTSEVDNPTLIKQAEEIPISINILRWENYNQTHPNSIFSNRFIGIGRDFITQTQAVDENSDSIQLTDICPVYGYNSIQEIKPIDDKTLLEVSTDGTHIYLRYFDYIEPE